MQRIIEGVKAITVELVEADPYLNLDMIAYGHNVISIIVSGSNRGDELSALKCVKDYLLILEQKGIHLDALERIDLDGSIIKQKVIEKKVNGLKSSIAELVPVYAGVTKTKNKKAVTATNTEKEKK